MLGRVSSRSLHATPTSAPTPAPSAPRDASGADMHTAPLHHHIECQLTSAPTTFHHQLQFSVEAVMYLLAGQADLSRLEYRLEQGPTEPLTSAHSATSLLSLTITILFLLPGLCSYCEWQVLRLKKRRGKKWLSHLSNFAHGKEKRKDKKTEILLSPTVERRLVVVLVVMVSHAVRTRAGERSASRGGVGWDQRKGEDGYSRSVHVAVKEGEVGGDELLLVHHHRQPHHDSVCNTTGHET